MGIAGRDSEDGECYSEEEEANGSIMHDYLRMLENNYPTEEQKVAIHEILCRHSVFYWAKVVQGKLEWSAEVIKIAQKLGWNGYFRTTHAAKKRNSGVMGEEEGCGYVAGTLCNQLEVYVLPEGATENGKSKLLRRMKEIGREKHGNHIDESSMVSVIGTLLFKHCVDDSRIRLAL